MGLKFGFFQFHQFKYPNNRKNTHWNWQHTFRYATHSYIAFDDVCVLVFVRYYLTASFYLWFVCGSNNYSNRNRRIINYHYLLQAWAMGRIINHHITAIIIDQNIEYSDVDQTHQIIIYVCECVFGFITRHAHHHPHQFRSSSLFLFIPIDVFITCT